MLMFSKNAITKCRVEAGFSHDIDSSTEQFFGVHQKATQSERAGARAQSHQQINIAIVAGVTPAHRAKHTNAGDPPPVGERNQFVAVGIDDRVHHWKFIHSPTGGERWRHEGLLMAHCETTAQDQIAITRHRRIADRGCA